jgi:glycosyltransferase involved in cell wall biosynthesis
MNIVFLFSDNFPGSSAYSNRIHSLAKGLTFYGNIVQVSVVYPGNHSKGNELAGLSGNFDSVDFRYYCGVKFKPKSRIKQIMIGLWGIYNFAFQYIFKAKKDTPDFIIACSSSIIHLTALYVLGKIKGINILREYNEYPLFIQNKKKYIASVARYKLLDGFIFMTHRLEEFFKVDLNQNQKSCIVNMTVDVDRFVAKSETPKRNIITLVGDILGEKDGVGNLLESFHLIHKKFPDLKLLLVGNIDNRDAYQKRLSTIERLGINGFVEFTGLIDRAQIPSIMQSSKLLLLPRPTSLQSESGFPTKLGEYLASGTPVVVTNTGEISYFLKNKVNAIIVEPDNPKVFAEKVIEVLGNQELYNQLEAKGIQVAEEHFSYKTQGKVLNDFLINFNL